MLSTYALAADLKGRVIAPDDEDYDVARTVFPGGIDRRPALIARVADAGDVARVIALARDTGLELAVRGGGHSAAGHGVTDGGIVIDLRDMNAVEIDPATRTAWAEGGATAGRYTDAAAEHGLATGFGDMGTVGVGGITLGGGIGFLVRKHGLTIDHVLAAEVVTADGEIVYTDADTHPDLFWAIRGGGGNFGVVTRLKLRLHELSTVLGGMLILPATPDVIAGFVAEAQAAPEEFSAIASVMKAPPMPFLPPEAHGRLILMAQMVYAGDLEAGQRVVDRVRALAEPIADMMRPLPYREMFPPEDDSFHPTAILRTTFVNTIDRAAAETILDRITSSTAPMSVVQIRVLGGAMARVPADATAFAHRQSRIMFNVAAIYDPSTSRRVEQVEWVAGLSAALDDGDRGAYAGFLADEGEERVRAAYPGATWERLTAAKATYDPENLFRLNQNIPPMSGRQAAPGR
jgi:FAD binding domain-containing protein/berberine-like enzyme